MRKTKINGTKDKIAMVNETIPTNHLKFTLRKYHLYMKMPIVPEARAGRGGGGQNVR
jgi:hypothetical protein